MKDTDTMGSRFCGSLYTVFSHDSYQCIDGRSCRPSSGICGGSMPQVATSLHRVFWRVHTTIAENQGRWWIMRQARNKLRVAEKSLHSKEDMPWREENILR